jgi:hypothetical protein
MTNSKWMTRNPLEDKTSQRETRAEFLPSLLITPDLRIHLDRLTKSNISLTARSNPTSTARATIE